MTSDGSKYLCPKCGNDEWTLLRQHTVWEWFRVDHVSEEGNFEVNDNEFGETESTGPFEDITCSHCDATAPASHPLWPTKENDHAEV